MGQQSPRDIVLKAGNLAAGIRNLRLPGGPQANNDLFAQFLEPGFQSAGGVFTDTAPTWQVLADHLNMFVLLDGTISWAQTNGIMDGYAGSRFDSTTDPRNLYFQRATSEVTAAILASGIGWPPQVWLGGYSLGGAVAMLMPTVSQGLPPGIVNSQVHTFGSPRPGGRTVSHIINGSTTVYRWMCDSDAVPLLPPHVNEFSGVVLAMGALPALRAQSFVHPAGGIVLHEDGSVTIADKPTPGNAFFTGALAGWLLNWDNGTYPGHAISNYLERLSLAHQRLTNAGHLGGAAAEKPANVNRQEVRRQAQGYAYNLAALEAQQNSVALNVPDDQLFLAVRSSGAWTVKLGGETVIAAGNKRAARRAAREGNDLLRDLQHAAAVDVQALLERLTTYFALAQEPASGFAPLMNTTWPQ